MTRTKRIIDSAGTCLCLVALAVGAAGAVHAHPGIDEQIRALDSQIAEEPGDARLYLRRGELHRIHRDFDAAEADYRRSLELAPDLRVAELCLGRLRLEEGRPAEARVILDSYLEARPHDADALATRARTLVALNEPLAAARDFGAAIDSAGSDAARPEYFLEQARAFEAAGPEHHADALAALDEGLVQLGEAVTLQLYAIDIELGRGNADAALQRLDRLASRSVRQEPWLVRKASILEAAGRVDEAREAYRQTLAAIQTLPATRRTNAAVARLEDEAREGMNRLEAARTGN